MSNGNKIIWIDDDPRRKRLADGIGATFVNTSTAHLPDKIEAIFEARQPPLVILDHFLINTKDNNRLYKRGSTIAEALKERWPDCPVVCVTAADKVPSIDRRTRLAYDKLFSSYNFLHNVNQIESIAKGFALIAKKKPLEELKLISLLKPPKDEVDRLSNALPSDLKKSILDASAPSTFYGWVEDLFNRPGFLYDSLWVATFIGLTEEGFQNVIQEFEKAKYNGIFSQSDDSRWWLSRLTQLLFRLVPPESGEMSWHVGRKLRGVSVQNYSRCYRCKKPFPETVAYLDSESNERRAMHIECTVLHPGYKRHLYFEDIRMMAGD